MTTHDLKIWPVYFDLHITRQMEFQIRRDDRKFEISDRLRLREWDPTTEKYSGRVALSRVTSVIRDLPGLQPGFVALGAFFQQIEKQQGVNHEEQESV